MEEIIELIKTGQNDLLVQKLNDKPSLVDSKTEQGISLLQFAAYCRNNIAVDILKMRMQKLDIFESSCIGNHEEVAKIMEKDPEILNSFSADGFTALGLASFFGHLSLVKLLLDKGANPNIASNNQFKVAPIHSACAISNYEIAKLLIQHGADVDAKQMQGNTPLHSAAHNGQTTLATLLLDNGADINARNDKGETPLFMANEKNFQEIANLIIKQGGS